MNILITLWMLVFPVMAANPDNAHPHTGVATKFTNPQKATLLTAEQNTLSEGKAVLKQIKEDNGGRGVAIFDVNATPTQVWSVITSFENYSSYIDEIAKCEQYAKNGNNISVDFVISSWGFDVQYYIKHDYNPAKGYMTWTLDYSRESDLDDSTGYWLVYPSPLDASKTRVEYSVDLRIKGWVPGFIQTMLAETGVENATKWVKKESEKL